MITNICVWINTNLLSYSPGGLGFTGKNPRCQHGWVPFEGSRRKACFSKFWSPFIFLSSCACFPSSSQENSMVLSLSKSSASLHSYESPCLQQSHSACVQPIITQEIVMKLTVLSPLTHFSLLLCPTPSAASNFESSWS